MINVWCLIGFGCMLSYVVLVLFWFYFGRNIDLFICKVFNIVGFVSIIVFGLLRLTLLCVRSIVLVKSCLLIMLDRLCLLLIDRLVKFVRFRFLLLFLVCLVIFLLRLFGCRNCLIGWVCMFVVLFFLVVYCRFWCLIICVVVLLRCIVMSWILILVIVILLSIMV